MNLGRTSAAAVQSTRALTAWLGGLDTRPRDAASSTWLRRV